MGQLYGLILHRICFTITYLVQGSNFHEKIHGVVIHDTYKLTAVSLSQGSDAHVQRLQGRIENEDCGYTSCVFILSGKNIFLFGSFGIRKVSYTVV